MNTRFFLSRARGVDVTTATLAILLASVCWRVAPATAAPPARVVSLAPAITETLFALGLGARVVGVSTWCDYPTEATSLPKVGSFSEPVAEAIVALHPDLVITSPSPGNESAVRAIERSGVRVAVVQGDGGIAEVRQSILDVGRAMEEGAAAEALVARMDGQLASVRERAARLEHPVAAVVVGREPLVLAGPASYLGELLTLAGGVNVADRVGGRWPRVGLEFLVVAAPAVLVDLSLPMGETAKGPGAAWAEAAAVPAVAAGRIVTDTAAVLLRPGPRLGEAAEALLAGLHPESPASVVAPAAPGGGAAFRTSGAGAAPAPSSAGAAPAGRAP